MIISIFLFLFGIIIHEYIHKWQLESRGIYSSWIEWLPRDGHYLPRIYFFSDEITKDVMNKMEIFPSTVTLLMWILAIIFW